MGNSSSNSGESFGNIYVRTEKPYYFSGEQVTGTIYLNIIKQGFPGNELHLKVKGQEECNWEETRTVSETDRDGKSVSRTEVDYYRGKNSFYSHRVRIYTFQGQFLPVGQYAFPFSFVLYGHLPGSFFEQGTDYKASIKYKVKAEIDSYEKKTKKIKHHQDLIVREPLKSQMQSLQGEMTVNAKTWCCISKGESHIKCVFDKNHYLPGDQAFLWIDVDNSNCDLDINQIQAQLTQSITMRANTGRERVVPRAVITENIPGITSSKSSGIPARSHAKDDNRKTMSIQLLNRSNQNDPNLKPSTTGQIVKNTYTLSATAVLSGCTCCQNSPSVVVPINIVAPVPVIYNQVPQISNWNPQTFDPVLVQFTDRDLYAKAGAPQSNYNYPQQNININQMNQGNQMYQ